MQSPAVDCQWSIFQTSAIDAFASRYQLNNSWAFKPATDPRPEPDPTPLLSYSMEVLHYAPYPNRPLFGPHGPSINDVVQGKLGDCYFLTALQSIAVKDPDWIRQSIRDNRDGTYTVRFFRDHWPVYVTVDNQLPTRPAAGFFMPASPAPATPSRRQSWRRRLRFIATRNMPIRAINIGWARDAFRDLNLFSGSFDGEAARDGDELLDRINMLLKKKDGVVFDTVWNVPFTLVRQHSYVVSRVYCDVNGQHVVLRNPWGHNPVGGGAYITLSAQEAIAACRVVHWGAMSRPLVTASASAAN